MDGNFVGSISRDFKEAMQRDIPGSPWHINVKTTADGWNNSNPARDRRQMPITQRESHIRSDFTVNNWLYCRDGRSHVGSWKNVQLLRSDARHLCYFCPGWAFDTQDETCLAATPSVGFINVNRPKSMHCLRITTKYSRDGRRRPVLSEGYRKHRD